MRIVRVSVGIEQPDGELVVSVGGETALDVELAGNRLGVEPIEPQHLVTHRAVAADRIAPRQRRHPLAEVAAGRETFVEVLPIVVVGAVGVPAAQFDTGRRQARHLPERHQQAVVAQRHQHRLRVAQLSFMHVAGDRHGAITEFTQRLPGARNVCPSDSGPSETARRRHRAGLQKAAARHRPIDSGRAHHRTIARSISRTGPQKRRRLRIIPVLHK